MKKLINLAQAVKIELKPAEESERFYFRTAKFSKGWFKKKEKRTIIEDAIQMGYSYDYWNSIEDFLTENGYAYQYNEKTNTIMVKPHVKILFSNDTMPVGVYFNTIEEAKTYFNELKNMAKENNLTFIELEK